MSWRLRNLGILSAIFLFLAPLNFASAATDQGRIWASGFELNSLTSDMEIEATGGTGTVAIVTSPVRSGSYAVQTTSASPAAWVRYRFAESNSDGPFYFRFYLRVADYPDTAQEIIVLDSTGGADRVGIQMTSNGTLQLMDLDGTTAQVGSDSSVLSLDTYYRVELKYDASAGLSAVSLEGRLGGTSFASSDTVVNSASIGRVSFGGTNAAANYNYYWDDLAINTTTWAGEGKIIHLKPNADGDNTTWLIGAGTGFNFEQVDEITPDDATTYLSDIVATGLTADDYNIEDATAIPSGSTISAVQVGVRGGGTGAAARTFVTRIKASSGETVEESSSIDWSINGWRTNQEGPNTRNYALVLYDLPGGSTSDWSISDLNNSQIGVRHDSLSVNEVRLSTIWLLVDYIEAAADTTAPAAVTDLAVSDPTTSSLDVSWTSPGDDNSTGTATSYDLRYSTATITDGNFSSATAVTGEPTPSVAGSSESMTVSGLSENTTYYFALKTSDEVPNTSTISNVPSATTLSEIASSVTIPPSRGSSVAPTRVLFSGMTYPGGKVRFFRRSSIDELTRNTYILDTEAAAGNDGRFSKEFLALLQGEYFFAVESLDKDGRSSGIFGFTASLIATNEVKITDIFMPPTVDFKENLISRGKDAQIFGYASPNNEIEIVIDGSLKLSARSDPSGYYLAGTSTRQLALGEHFVRARQIDSFSNSSQLSPAKSFTVSSLLYPKADFNKDGIMTIADWSIFLSRWQSKEAATRKSIDFDLNGKVDIADFSIFLRILKAL